LERNPKIQVIISAKSALYRWLVPANRDQSFGGSMAINFLQTPDGSDDSIRFLLIERLKGYLFGITISELTKGV
jgi:hypothetical protein